jgi:peptidoglycan hydrolase CwlO-like protein
MSQPVKIILAILLALFLIFIGAHVFSFFSEQNDLSKNLSEANVRLSQAEQQEADLQNQTQYLTNQANLEKELRAEFNYKKPGETMIIIVPQQGTSSASSTR